MKIVCIGGGPAGLYFALLYKKARPDADITVLERNAAGVTFGWGVVFSDETLSYLEENDPPTHEAITRSFAHWTAIDIHYKGACLRSDGHGFSGIARKELLQILQDRCRELGVTLQFDTEVDDYKSLTAGADLVIACDGVKSKIRDQYAEGPTLTPGAPDFPVQRFQNCSAIPNTCEDVMSSFETHGFTRLHKFVFEIQQPQSHSNPGLEFLRVERLRQVIVGPGFEPFHHAFLGIFRCQEQKVGIRFGTQLAQGAAHVDPILSRHHPVKERHTRRVGSLQRFPRSVAVFDGNHLVSPFQQKSLEHSSRYQ